MPEPLTAQDRAEAPKGPSPAQLAEKGRIRPVLIYPDPALRQSCAPVGRLDWASLCQLAGDLLVTMYRAKGRGLAAPQIGEPWRILVMDAGWKSGNPQPRILLDPQVTFLSGPDETMAESCLSIPGQPIDVTRPVDISVSHFDLMGDARTTFLSGIEARIVQHEVDHLNGRLIIDYQEQTAIVAAR